MNGGEFFGRELAWSPAEKKIARRAYEQAYQRHCASIRAKVTKMLATASAPSDIWKIYDYLSGQRRTFDKMYDYRYSVLVTVFSVLLSEGWLTVADLAGLQENKIEQIQKWAAL